MHGVVLYYCYYYYGETVHFQVAYWNRGFESKTNPKLKISDGIKNITVRNNIYNHIKQKCTPDECQQTLVQIDEQYTSISY